MLAVARLEDLVVVTWEAEPEALRARLPAGVVADPLLVSAVAYRYRDLRLRGLPGPRLACGQVHLRAYVRVGDLHGVFFLETVQDSRWAALPRWLWGMPWRRGGVLIAPHGEAGVRVRAPGIDLAATPSPVGAPPPPATIDPTVGWYQGRRGLRRFEVAYEAGPPVPCEAGGSGVRSLQRDGLVSAPPTSAFLRERVDIEIQLPPRAADH